MSKIVGLFRFWRSFLLFVFPLLLLPLPILVKTQASRCAYVMIIVAVFWMTEALPLEITSLIPVIGFPLLGVLSTQGVSLAYMNRTNMMNLGSLIIAVAIEHSNLHKRMALFVILHIGQSPRRLLAGFMVTTMFFSMWIPNLAAVVMMIPFLNAIVEELSKIEANAREQAMKDSAEVESSFQLDENFQKINKHITNENNIHESRMKQKDLDKNYQALKDMYFLGTAYAGNIGGSGSPLGSNANLVTKNLLESSFKEDTGYNFGTWVLFNTPGMVINTFIAWIWLQYFFLGFKKNQFASTTREKEKAIKSFIKKNYKELGPVTFHEVVVISLFLVIFCLWFFRNPGFVDGWVALLEQLLGWELDISDATPTILIAILFFIIPRKPTIWPFVKMSEKTRSSEMCLTWSIVQEKLPWGAIILLGGGFALAEASDKSGLSLWLGEQLRGLDVLPPPAVVFIVTLMTTATTELASNAATSSILMPILRDLSLAICVNPLYLIIPATASCVYAFLLPVASPPNVIVFIAANMKISTMIKAGLMMNLVCLIVINIMINTLGVVMFDVYNFPSWANSTTGKYIPTC